MHDWLMLNHVWVGIALLIPLSLICVGMLIWIVRIVLNEDSVVITDDEEEEK